MVVDWFWIGFGLALPVVPCLVWFTAWSVTMMDAVKAHLDYRTLEMQFLELERKINQLREKREQRDEEIYDIAKSLQLLLVKHEDLPILASEILDKVARLAGHNDWDEFCLSEEEIHALDDADECYREESCNE